MLSRFYLFCLRANGEDVGDERLASSGLRFARPDNLPPHWPRGSAGPLKGIHQQLIYSRW